MKVLKWLDEHLEEAILIVLLAAITCVMMAQIIARTFAASMTWPEEFSRYCYIWSVFLSLGYTVKKGNMLKVGVLMDLFPLKVRKSIEITGNLIMLVIFGILFRYSIIYTGKIKVMGQVSPAMGVPMSFMYTATIIGFGLAVIRTIELIIYNVKHFNEKAESTLEATIKEAQQEVQVNAAGANKTGGEA